MQDKETIRKKLLSLRNQLPKDKRQAFSHAIKEQLFSLPVAQQAAVIMLFLAFGSEVDTWCILEHGVAQGKTIAAPVCLPATKELLIYPISRKEEAVVGHWDILEPPRNNQPISPDVLDIVVVPGLAFDRQGNRIGYGAGYYDRFLSNVPNTCKIGICFHIQLMDTLPKAAHDVPVDLVITEKEVVAV
ncbi:MAG: 5-formyltetrahydrofolate cyclo-ligase [Firmicutes bacterium]|nr:5-formyltetrahydrofolate cyclo-ligase [Bacillota bacterium]